MSKKTSIMVEVDDRVYDLVIAPHKKNKTFSKLLSTLLSGYLEDQYIRGFAEDTLDDMRRASSSALEEIIGNMHEGLANMGMYTEELKSNTMEGMNTFEGKLSGLDKNNPHMGADSSEEIRELRESIMGLAEQNRSIMEMLSRVVGGVSAGSDGGVSVRLSGIGSDSEVTISDRSDRSMRVGIDPVVESPYSEEIIGGTDEENEIDGASLLASLCSGMSFGD